MDGPLLKEVWQVLKNFFGRCMYCPRKLIFFVEFTALTTRGYVIYLTQNFESMNFIVLKCVLGFTFWLNSEEV